MSFQTPYKSVFQSQGDEWKGNERIEKNRKRTEKEQKKNRTRAEKEQNKNRKRTEKEQKRTE